MDTQTALATLLDQNASLEAVARHLDGLNHQVRLDQCRSLNRNSQRALFNLASPEAVTLADLVPKGVAPCTEVIQFGMNTLPLPTGLRKFEKRFCRPQDDTQRLFGFNEGSTRSLIGPGYFVAVPTLGNAQWQARGAVVVDYYQVPDGPVVDGWPAVVSNSRGLQMFVFAGTRDFMRRVSDWVTIGAAYKGEKALDHYFVLVRNP